MNLFLRTTDKATMDAALEHAGLFDSRTGWQHPGIVRIGPIPARSDESGTVVDPGDARYHVNLRAEPDLTPETIAALPSIAPPTNPYTVIA